MLAELNPDKVCYIIVKAREYNGTDEVGGDASNATDDGFSSALTENNERPVRAELVSFINNLNDDEKVELVALCWMGRGDFEGDWKGAMAEARGPGAYRTANYLLDMPLLADYLEDGLSGFDLSCEDMERGRL
ncbi:MAG: hypothetical protein JWM36_1307 [Hyphomicrobiales bacterium]|nr:hypothetical protein [Hyphomicrobiales bacterium]